MRPPSKARRLAQLERHLADDLQRLPAEETLRRQAEALLASGVAVAAAGESAIEVADPYEPAVRMHVRLDPRLSVPANADRLFEKARRVGARAGAGRGAARADAGRAARRERGRGAAPLGARAWPTFPTRRAAEPAAAADGRPAPLPDRRAA